MESTIEKSIPRGTNEARFDTGRLTEESSGIGPETAIADCSNSVDVAGSGAPNKNSTIVCQPDSTTVLNELAWLLATHDIEPPDNLDAVALAEQACRRTGYRQATFVDTLAAAYAHAGRFQDAVATARQALELTTSAGQAGLAEVIRARLKLYESGQPYRAETHSLLDD